MPKQIVVDQQIFKNLNVATCWKRLAIPSIKYNKG